MAETDVVEKWPGWPPQGATRDDLLASLRWQRAEELQIQEREKTEYVEALAEWEATIEAFRRSS